MFQIMKPLTLRRLTRRLVKKALVVKKTSKGTQGSRTIFKVFSKNTLLVDKNLLKGQRLLRYFPGFSNFYDTVKRFNLDCKVS